MQELSIDEQKVLTEFLGDKWKEPKDFGGLRITVKGIHLDFNDWRVVGRLIERVQAELSNEIIPLPFRQTLEHQMVHAMFYPNTKLAICKAIIDYKNHQK